MRFKLFLLSALAAIVSCTTFQEEALNVFEVDRDYILLEYGASVQTVTVKSGTKWDVASRPSWVNVQSVKSTDNPFEWKLALSVSANNGEGRQSRIDLVNQTSKLSVVVNQAARPMVHVQSISLPGSVEINLGDRKQLTPSILPENADNKSVTWSSSNSFAVSVDDNGCIEAHYAISPVTITATTVDGGLSARCAVNVVVPITDITLSCGNSVTIEQGSYLDIYATVVPYNTTYKSLKWTSSQPSVATVSSDGRVHAVSDGRSVIRAASVNDPDVYAECTVTVVKQSVPVSSVSLYPSSKILYVGQEFTVVSTVYPSDATDQTLVWSSSDSRVVSVDSNRRVKAVGAGKAVVTAEASNGVKGTCTIEVRVPVSSVSISQTSLTLSESQSYTLSAVVLPADAYDKSVEWSSDNIPVASVDQSGRVTALKTGKAIIKVETKDGNYVAKCSVTVNPGKVSVTGMRLSSYSFNGVPLYQEDRVTVTIIPSDAENKDVEWEVDSPDVVTMGLEGQNVIVLKARDAGHARITVRSVDNPAIYRIIDYSVSFNMPGFTNLGLPSGVCWATFNIGASAWQERGGYYAWGATSISDDYSWSGYIWCRGTSTSLTKYNNNYSYGDVDYLTRLESTDDAAVHYFGKAVRMPDKADWEELIQNCSFTWNTRNGVDGLDVKSKINNKMIFLPAAGYYGGKSLENDGDAGYYWSASLVEGDSQSAYYFWFTKRDHYINDNFNRCRGFTIRPVYQKQ